MGKVATGTVALLLLLAAVLGGAGGCGEADKPTELQPVEIREYEGMKLSSVDDFRENSIKGPQKVDIESYQLKISGLAENPTTYTYDEVLSKHQSYKKVVTLNCVEGWSVTRYKMNEVTIPQERGFPFQLVADSKYGYKWIKWITEIELSDDENYRGFWESQGYSNSANLGERFFD
jgi:DMSO/TMAO reductase YedYZ molybdopterin-dependent catalytic subunit